jgi:hypothetical protein
VDVVDPTKANESTGIGFATRWLGKPLRLKGPHGHTRGVVPLWRHAPDIDAPRNPSILTNACFTENIRIGSYSNKALRAR